MIDSGVPVALGSDFNPGSSMTFNLPLIMSIACTQMKLTPAEALCATTINAAYACGVGAEVGSIEKGKKADLILWDATSYRTIAYHYGINLVRTVIKSGRLYPNSRGRR
jgi:imidazolonepropionase